MKNESMEEVGLEKREKEREMERLEETRVRNEGDEKIWVRGAYREKRRTENEIEIKR